MRAVLPIAGDWFRLVRDQKSFRILAVIFGALSLLTVAFKVDPRRIELFFVLDIDLGGLGGAGDRSGGLGERPGDLVMFFVLKAYTWFLPLLAYVAALLATSGIVPDMLRKGRIDTVLARPVARWEFVAGSYLGGLLYVAALALILCAGSWLGFAMRGRVLDPAWFWNVPLIVARYAILYALILAFGVVLRSGASAVVITLVLWLLGNLASEFHETLKAYDRAPEVVKLRALSGLVSGPARTALDATYLVLPKTGQIDDLGNRVLERVIGSPVLQDMLKHEPGAAEALASIDWRTVAGTSAALIAAALLWAAWTLKRRDL